MNKSQIIAAAACIGVLVPVVLFARTFNTAYSDCMRVAVNTYQTSLIDSQHQYDTALESAMQSRRTAYFNAWLSTEDTDQRRAQQDADKAFSSTVSAARKFQQGLDRDSGRTYSDAQHTCSRIQNFVSSSSSSHTSSSHSSTSSRSSSSSSHQNTCNTGDIICSDGRRFPTCTKDGAVIDYFINPCLRLGACGDHICQSDETATMFPGHVGAPYYCPEDCRFTP